MIDNTQKIPEIKKLSYINMNKEYVEIELTKHDLNEIDDYIHKYLDSVYSKFGFVYGVNKIIEINDKKYKTEYIGKFIHNFKNYNSIIKRNEIRDKETFFKYIKNNLFQLFHYDGVFFDNSYTIITRTSNKGSRGEIEVKKAFEKLIGGKITNPTVAEDISGIDGSFIYNNEKFTLQVKPFLNQCRVEDNIKIESDGSLSFNTNYLGLYREIKSNRGNLYDIIILRNGKYLDKIKTTKSYYITNQRHVALNITI